MNKLYAFLNRSVNKQVDKAGFISCGYANGYVAIPPTHPMHHLDYNDVDEKVDVHGGLTFGRKASEVKDWEDVECIGFDNISDIPDDYFVYGFDTMHYNDGPWLNREWCVSETKDLLQQFEQMQEAK